MISTPPKQRRSNGGVYQHENEWLFSEDDLASLFWADITACEAVSSREVNCMIFHLCLSKWIDQTVKAIARLRLAFSNLHHIA